jgi:metal-responsive CopG/Arc/MetJ family transcriptional regulator
MRATRRRSRVFTVSFPEDLARQVERVAKEESRNLSELFREAFRSYRLQRVRTRLREDAEYARTRNPRRYTEGDVEALVDQLRAERK